MLGGRNPWWGGTHGDALPMQERCLCALLVWEGVPPCRRPGPVTMNGPYLCPYPCMLLSIRTTIKMQVNEMIGLEKFREELARLVAKLPFIELGSLLRFIRVKRARPKRIVHCNFLLQMFFSRLIY